jgi:hypothetical protein
MKLTLWFAQRPLVRGAYELDGAAVGVRNDRETGLGTQGAKRYVFGVDEFVDDQKSSVVITNTIRCGDLVKHIDRYTGNLLIGCINCGFINYLSKNIRDYTEDMEID